MSDFAILVLDEETTVLDDLGLVGRRPTSTSSVQCLKKVCINTLRSNTRAKPKKSCACYSKFAHVESLA